MAVIRRYEERLLPWDVFLLLPHPPWDGPPVPRFLPKWPWLWEKPHYSMLLRLLPESFLTVTLHLWPLWDPRLEGDYRAVLRNEGDVLIATGDIVQTVRMLGERILEAIPMANAPTGPRAQSTVTFHFVKRGVLEVIQRLWDYLWTREVAVETTATVTIPGYQTERYVVDDYRKEISVDARLPVNELIWGA